MPRWTCPTLGYINYTISKALSELGDMVAELGVREADEQLYKVFGLGKKKQMQLCDYDSYLQIEDENLRDKVRNIVVDASQISSDNQSVSVLADVLLGGAAAPDVYEKAGKTFLTVVTGTGTVYGFVRLAATWVTFSSHWPISARTSRLSEQKTALRLMTPY